ncbi:glycoside hydrolase family 9 protein [Chryseolinea sp. T2]|uniref:glycoside hydrolase family 9 protein n=1 Tax=Chryseolinea sp. T2 TaxID=3129255 RepID=UPI003076C9AE
MHKRLHFSSGGTTNCSPKLTSFLTASVLLWMMLTATTTLGADNAWIRINLMGYKPGSVKVAVLCSKGEISVEKFKLLRASDNSVVFEGSAGKDFGAYGPFSHTFRLDFSAVHETGTYVLSAGTTVSLVFEIGDDVYDGAADFVLQYMRQQRSKYNPYLRDSCHTADGYTMDGPMPDSTHLDVSGGWHDATDYLQYVTTSANATYHLLASFRDFPAVFGDAHLDNGLPGSNGVADVLDEASWGLQWLLKMHPRSDWMFNQLADDRDHKGFRLPTKDTASYGKGRERPIYFVTGKVQGLGKYKNRTTGTSSTAGKFASAFGLGYEIFKDTSAVLGNKLLGRAKSAYEFGLRIPGNTQTACYVSPYFYEEDNWVDDMELAAAQLFGVTGENRYFNAARGYADQEPQTPWLGADTAAHYQWYPFINLGHYELAKRAKGSARSQVVAYYREGIERVYGRASKNAFLRGVPFIWCSNNLQTSFAIQCYWYRKLTGDTQFEALEQAAFDWIMGCNPWGTSMVVGLPADRDFPDDPHSSLNVLYGYQTLGALVDGPVYGTIYRKQLGVTIVHGDEYAEFQSPYVVYHDDYGDYATNEPTMDGTASLVYLMAAMQAENGLANFTLDHGAIVRGSRKDKKIAIVFTGDEYADGGNTIQRTLKENKAKASFFFTGNFYRDKHFSKLIRQLKKDGHYLGAHSDKHLLYCSWTNRDSTLVSREIFMNDLEANYREMNRFGIIRESSPYFLPPFEWHNDTIASWTASAGLRLINLTQGTLSHADYTTPSMKNYRSSDEIMNSITSKADQMNGFILLMHVGTDGERRDKLYDRLPELIAHLRAKGYELVTVNELLRSK